MVSLISSGDNRGVSTIRHAKNQLDKTLVMHKGNQFFLIDNKNLEKISFKAILCQG